MRDFLVPSRMHPGKFYALPQAPQQFKQLLMMAGYDRYFQIAPCFRDEDSRADRSPGEFYQLDFEMSFVTQEDVFAAIEPVLYGIFDEFGGFRRPAKPDLTPYPFPRIPYAESMLKYGNDKPDLRNPLVITDVTSVFERDDVEFKAFKSVIAKGGVVRAIRAPNVGDRPRSFFDKLNDWAKGMGAPGLGYILFEAAGGKGPIAKPEAAQAALREAAGLEVGDAVFFVCDQPAAAAKLAGFRPHQDRRRPRHRGEERLPLLLDRRFPDVRARRGNRQDRLQPQPVLDAPGRLDALENQDPLTINAYQYDIVCNGIELSSGAIRNHLPEVMYKAFAIAGYPPEELEARFGGMLSAMKLGARRTAAPPPASTASSCCWRMSRTSARSSSSRSTSAPKTS